MAFRKNLRALSFVLSWIGCASVTVAGAQLDSVTIAERRGARSCNDTFVAMQDATPSTITTDPINDHATPSTITFPNNMS